MYHHLIGVVLLLSWLSSCTNEELLSEEVPVPIRLAIEDGNMQTKAPVATIDATNISNVGIYGVQEGSTTGQFPWTASPYVSNLVPSGISGNQLSFSSKLYYPLGGKRVLFYGYYPRTAATSGTNYITAPSAGVAPAYNFTLTGAEDIMQAVSSPSGSNNPATVALSFNHKLIQIQVVTSAITGLLSSIKLLGVTNTGKMNIETGVVTYNPAVVDIPLVLPALSSTTNPVMVPADVASYKVEIGVTILVTLIKSTYLIKPTTGTFKAGTVYVISL